MVEVWIFFLSALLLFFSFVSLSFSFFHYLSIYISIHLPFPSSLSFVISYSFAFFFTTFSFVFVVQSLSLFLSVHRLVGPLSPPPSSTHIHGLLPSLFRRVRAVTLTPATPRRHSLIGPITVTRASLPPPPPPSLRRPESDLMMTSAERAL